jgi:hypothetical protein
MAKRYSPLPAQLLDATLGGDLLRVRARSLRATRCRCAAPSPPLPPRRVPRRHAHDTRRTAPRRRGAAPTPALRRARAATHAPLTLVSPRAHTCPETLTRVAPPPPRAQMHRLLLNNVGLVNERLQDGARTALHVAVERGNEAAVTLLLAQCVCSAVFSALSARARAHSPTCCPRLISARRPALRACHTAPATRTARRRTATARARWSWR